MWLALPGGSLRVGDPAIEKALLELLREEVNVKQLELIGDDSDLVDRRVKPLLPRIGPRLGSAIRGSRGGPGERGRVPARGASAWREWIWPADEGRDPRHISRAGTAVAHEDGLVVIHRHRPSMNALRAEGDARELTRAVQDLRKQAGLELRRADRTLARTLPAALLAPIEPYLAALWLTTPSPARSPPRRATLRCGRSASTDQRWGSVPLASAASGCYDFMR